MDNISNLRNQYKKTCNKWKICIDNPFFNAERIYPIQQRKVKELIEDITVNNNVNKIIIFGSSTTNKCHIGSDVDIYIDTNEERINMKKQYDFEFDLWTNYTVDNRLKEEITKSGVIVYEK